MCCKNPPICIIAVYTMSIHISAVQQRSLGVYSGVHTDSVLWIVDPSVHCVYPVFLTVLSCILLHDDAQNFGLLAEMELKGPEKSRI